MAKQTTTPQNYINHIALVLDASGSMSHLERDVIKVADAQIEHLARRSKELDQETRATVYAFWNTRDIRCLFYDKDVLRLPSIAPYYRANGPSTPLIDATLLALTDLEKTPELYGEHAFLIYVLTDGQENSSVARPVALETKITRLPDHWTLATFVPNPVAVAEAKKFGFQKENIALWDTSARGIGEVGETIRKATDTFMTGRSQGVRGYRNLFNVDTSKLKASTVHANLNKLGFGQYRLWTVPRDTRIDQFIEYQTGRPYRLGEGYYQLTVPVKVQPAKQIAIREKKTHNVYVGPAARQILGLPDYEVRINPASTPEFDVFIQSTSVNRKLLKDQQVLVIS